MTKNKHDLVMWTILFLILIFKTAFKNLEKNNKRGAHKYVFNFYDP